MTQVLGITGLGGIERTGMVHTDLQCGDEPARALNLLSGSIAPHKYVVLGLTPWWLRLLFRWPKWFVIAAQDIDLNESHPKV